MGIATKMSVIIRIIIPTIMIMILTFFKYPFKFVAVY